MQRAEDKRSQGTVKHIRGIVIKGERTVGYIARQITTYILYYVAET